MSQTSQTASSFLTSTNLATLGVDLATQAKLQRVAEDLAAFGRRSTEQAFGVGECLNEAAKLLPEGAFPKWVKPACGLQVRSARAYIAVFRNLSPYRDELVDLAVSTTVLFHLSAAAPDQIEAAMTFAEDNGRLQVADVKAILREGDEGDGMKPGSDHFSAGGLAGLKSLMAIKARDGLKLYVAHVDQIRQKLLAALGKKRVIKEALVKEVQDLARIARAELESLALFIETDGDFLGRSPRATTFPKASEWAGVNDTLLKLGNVESWPKSAAVREWLETEVLPVLDWSTSKERKPKWPFARPATEASATEPSIAADNDNASEEVDADGFEPSEDAAVVRQQVAEAPSLANEQQDLDETSPAVAMA
ncbi:hypothetical protein [Pararhizobium sp. O133]|uniref:hypothetical protein n=1 Tax=Pararhizobium sp. O133 TaxID=3449278 RepID=UPI003F686DDB